MTTEELERIIEAQAENQNLDFKADIAWNAQDLVKDFIAMANVRDGGTIVIGVEEKEGAFNGTGVIEANLKSFKIDHMKDQLSSYTDPAVEFRMMFPTDLKGNKYVVIKIQPFKEIPIISRSSIPKKLIGNTIYYRNTNKKVESGPISNSNDLRDIIEAAAIKLMQRRTAAGFSALPEPGSKNMELQKVLNNEISDLPSEGILAKIKKRGYWEIRFSPTEIGKIENLKTCLEIVDRSKTRLNWDFPHVPANNTDKEWVLPMESCYQAVSDLGARKEFWRIYQSEQFYMCRGLVEDWYEEDGRRKSLAESYPTGTTLTIYGSLIFFITEVFEFLARLGQNGLYKQGVTVTLTLNKAKNRELRIDASGRTPFMYNRITGAETISVQEIYDIESVIADGTALGNILILQIMDKFSYNPSAEGILQAQHQWLKGTFE